jgi:hypothetical protein
LFDDFLPQPSFRHSPYFRGSNESPNEAPIDDESLATKASSIQIRDEFASAEARCMTGLFPYIRVDTEWKDHSWSNALREPVKASENKKLEACV